MPEENEKQPQEKIDIKSEEIEKDAEDAEDSSEETEVIVSKGADFDVCLKNGHRSNCSVCNHPASVDAIILYFNCGKKIRTVRRWLKSKHNYEIDAVRLENHFKRHVEPWVTEDLVLREQRYRELQNRAQRKPTMDNFSRLREMHWEFLEDLYTYKPNALTNKNEREEHRKMAKEFTELVKSYKELCLLEWEMIGQGRSDEEQKDIMNKYVEQMIKKHLSAIGEIDNDVKQKISEKLGIETPVFADEENIYEKG